MTDKTYWPIGTGLSNPHAGAWLEAGRVVEIAVYRVPILNVTLTESEALDLCEALQFCLDEAYAHKRIEVDE